MNNRYDESPFDDTEIFANFFFWDVDGTPYTAQLGTSVQPHEVDEIDVDNAHTYFAREIEREWEVTEGCILVCTGLVA